ncbi:MAG: signal peptidase II [Candidatus Aquicultorales bacterium]
MLLVVAVITFLVDQISKYAIRASLAEGASLPVVGGFFNIAHVRNAGAAFGLFPERSSFLIIVSLFIIVAILGYYVFAKPTNVVVKGALGLELGGALGNLVDRLVNGKVTDFLDFNGLWPVFNLADSAIVVGAVVMATVLLFAVQPEEAVENKAGD